MTKSTAIVKAEEGATVLIATADRLRGHVEVLPLETREDEEKATAIVRAIEACVARGEETRLALVAPLKKETSAIDALFREPKRVLEGIAAQLRRRLAERAEAQRRAEREAQRIALEQARREREAVERADADAVKAAQVVSNAALAAVPAETAPPPGVSFRWSWSYTIADLSQVPEQYTARVLNADAVKAEIKRAEMEARDPSIPGLVFERKASTVVGKKYTK